MPKTRKEDSHKSNPYIGKSISKNLLTPCRRVGLPRKRKSSSNNSINQSLSHIESILDKSYEEETVTRAALSPELYENNQQEIEFREDLNKKTRKEGIEQCLEINNDQNQQLEEIVENNQDQKENNNLETVDLQDDKTIQTKRKHKSVKKSKKESKTDKSENRRDKKKKKSKTIEVESSRTRSPILFDDDEDFVADDKLKMQQIKNMKAKSKSYDCKLLDITKTNNNENNRELTVKLRRIDSDPLPRVYTNKKLDKTEDCNRKDLKISDLDDDESFQVNKINSPDLKESKILSPKNKQDSPELPKLEPVSSTKKTRKISRSLSLKKTHSGEQNLDLSDDFENYPPPPLLQIKPDKIDELEREIAKKREIIENLQQTEIYKRLHNVDDLKDLTEIFKTGCISAINDLLPQLKPYAEIDMETLLEKLNVPEHLIKLSTNGELI